MSRVRLQLLPASGRSSIAIQIQGSSKDFLRPTGLGRTGTSLCVVITGRGDPGKKLMGILPESVGLGGLPQNLVCVVPLICFFLLLSICDLSFLFVPRSSRPSVAELSVERKDFKNFGDRRSSLQHFFGTRPFCFLFFWP
jgi:hypothetical protein